MERGRRFVRRRQNALAQGRDATWVTLADSELWSYEALRSDPLRSAFQPCPTTSTTSGKHGGTLPKGEGDRNKGADPLTPPDFAPYICTLRGRLCLLRNRLDAERHWAEPVGAAGKLNARWESST